MINRVADIIGRNSHLIEWQICPKGPYMTFCTRDSDYQTVTAVFKINTVGNVEEIRGGDLSVLISYHTI